MIDRELLGTLRQVVGAQYVSTGRADTEVYRYDASLAGSSSDRAAPDAVVLPADTEETAAVVRAASRAGVPCVPRGFGTNLSGGSVASRGGLIVELSRLNRILEIKPEGRYAVVQAGVTNLELQDALAPLGLTYVPDPASQKVSTLGGNVAENSGGPHCLKYGVTSNHVLGMTVVLSGGEVVRFGGPALDPPGYDLRGVLVGSEGTLGIATELVVRILPSPESVLTLLAVYDTHADAARSVSAIIAAGIVPATLEMMDATVIRAVEDSKPCGYPRRAAAVLIIEVDGPAVGLARQAQQIREICTCNGCGEVRKAKDATERDRLWAGRRGAFGAIARLAPSYLVADCTVPRTRLPDAMARVSAIAERYQLPHGNVFHAGDGNLHPLLLFDSRDPEQVRRVHQAGHEIMQACVDLGGTITGEHGVGMEKAEAMRMVFSEHALDAQRRLREAFDPSDLLNPGKILPPAILLAKKPRPVVAPTKPRPLVAPTPTHAGTARRHELIPANAAEACDVVRRAYVERTRLLPAGNATRLDFGNHLEQQQGSEQDVALLRSARLSGVVDYDPANQVIAAGAGMSLDSLQEKLAENEQWLPLRPPPDGRHTLGGLAALGLCGPERLRYGAPRDLLLGLKFVSGTGELISVGGRVVKNVAGYDLTRLLVGSAGTLGLITELTWRILSLPQRCVALVASGSLDRCVAAAAKLLRSKLEPNVVVGVPQRPTLPADGDKAWQLLAGFEGFEQTVDFQVEGCREICAGAGLGGQERREYPPREGMCGRFFDVLEESPLLLRTDLPPNRILAFTSAAWDVLREAAVLIDFGCGRIMTATPNLTDDAWRRFGSICEEMGGHTILEKASEEFARHHDVFGTPKADWQVTHRIKAALDPHHVFAPGRLPGRK